MKYVKIIVATAAVVALGYVMWPNNGAPTSQGQSTPASGAALASIVLPETFSANALIGQNVFNGKCAVCHAANGVGQQGVAPPLINKIYEPNHHGDEAFQRAAALGVQSHHWTFGNMPPIENVTRGDVKMILAYIREIQRANGIN